MPCFRPIKCWQAGNGSGIVFDERKAATGAVLQEIPCYWCIGCRMTRSQEWSTRIYHEAMLHDFNSFVTLTYSDAFLPDNYSVSVSEMQKFMKRVRKGLSDIRVRYFACGEYGDRNFRPHYHLIIFGYDFPDRVPWRKAPSGMISYRSAELERYWPFGHCEVGTVTQQSAGYVARYVLKKVTGMDAEEHYRRVHPLTGEVVFVRPEFITMSRRPGIGGSWFEQFSCDAFPSDFVTVDGSKKPVPRYYLNKLSDDDKEVVKKKRVERAEERWEDSTPQRLAVREEVLERKVEQLKRDMDTEQ